MSKYITVVPANQSQIDDLNIQVGAKYRWVIYEMDVAKIDRIRNGVKESYKKLKAGDNSAITKALSDPDIQDYMAKNPDSSIGEMIAELAADEKSGVDQMETRINQLLMHANDAGAGFRNEILNWDFMAYYTGSMVERGNQGKLAVYPKRTLVSREGQKFVLTDGGLWINRQGLVLKDDTYNKTLNPYDALWYWYHDAMYPVKNTTPYVNILTKFPVTGLIYVYKQRENGERMKFHLTGGSRKRMSVNIDPDQGGDKQQDTSKQYDNLDTEYSLTRDSFMDMYMPFNDNRWSLMSNDKDIDEWVVNLYNVPDKGRAAYLCDCALARSLEERMQEIFTELMAFKANGQTYASVDNLAPNHKYFYDEVKGLYRRYVQLLDKGEMGEVEMISWGDEYVTFPAWQVGAIYFQDKSHLGNRRNITCKFGNWSLYDNVAKSWLLPVSYYSSLSQYVASQGSGTIDPANDVKDIYMTNQDGKYLAAGASEILNGTSDKMFDEYDAKNNNTGAKFTLMRPDRYNTKAPDFVPENGFVPYTVSFGNRPNLMMEVSVGFGYPYPVTCTAVGDDDEIEFEDPTVKKVVCKSIGKAKVTRADMRNYKHFVYDSSYNDDIKSLYDLYKMPALESFTWTNTCAIPTANFSNCQSLIDVTIKNASACGIDFTTCPTLVNLTIKGVSTYVNIDEKYRTPSIPEIPGCENRMYPNLMKVDKINLNSCINLKRVDINYTDMKEVALDKCAHIDSLNLEYNMLSKVDASNLYGVIPWVGFQLRSDGAMVEYPVRESDINDYNISKWFTIDGYGYLDENVLCKNVWGGYKVKLYTADPKVRVLDTTKFNGKTSVSNHREDWGVIIGDKYYERWDIDRVREIMGWRYRSVNIYRPTDFDADDILAINFDEYYLNMDENLYIALLAKYGDDKTNYDPNAYPDPTTWRYWTTRKIWNRAKLESLTDLDISGFGIKTLYSLNALCPNLETLDCSGNDIDKLNLNLFKKLKRVNCSDNRLTELKLTTDNTDIIEINCSNNQLSELDLTMLPKLEILACSHNGLLYLNLEKLSELTYLNCSDNALGDLDIRDARKLINLDCSRNNFSPTTTQTGISLVMSQADNNSLKYLTLSQVCRGSLWQQADFSNFKNLTNLDISKNPTLMGLTLRNNDYFSDLDISGTSISKVYVRNLGGSNVSGTGGYLLVDNCLKGLSTFNAENSNFGAAHPNVCLTSNNSKLADINLYNCDIDKIGVKSAPSQGFKQLLVGQDYRNSGRRVAVEFVDGDVLAWWDQTQKGQPKNVNTFGYIGDAITAYLLEKELTRDVITENTFKLKESLGEAQYEKLRQKYAPEVQVIPEDVLRKIPTLDCRETGPIKNIKFVSQLMPGVIALYLKQSDFDNGHFEWAGASLKIMDLENPNPEDRTKQVIMIPRGSTDVATLRIIGYDFVADSSTPLEETISTYKEVYLDGSTGFCGNDGIFKGYEFKINSRFKTLSLDNTDVKEFHMGAAYSIDKISLHGCDIKHLRLYKGYCRPIGTFMMDDNVTANPDFKVSFDDPDAAMSYTAKAKLAYPNARQYVRLEFGGSRFNDQTLDIRVPICTADGIQHMRKLAKGYWLHGEIGDEHGVYAEQLDDETVDGIVSLFQTDDGYLEHWKANGKYPDGLHYNEVNNLYSLNINGRHLTSVGFFTFLYNLRRLYASDNAIEMEQFKLDRWASNLEDVTMNNNPQLKSLWVYNPAGDPIGPIKGNRFEISGCGITGSGLNVIFPYYSYIIANDMPTLTSVTVKSTDKVDGLKINNTGVKEISIDKSIEHLYAQNLTSDQVHIYLKKLPKYWSLLQLDNSPKVTLELGSLDDINNWLTTFASKYDAINVSYKGIKVEKGTDFAMYQTLIDLFGENFAEVLPTKDVIDIDGHEVDENTLKYILDHVKRAPLKLLADYGTLDAEQLVFDSPGLSYSNLLLSYCPNLKKISINGPVTRRVATSNTVLELKDCKQLVSIGDAISKFESISINGCPKLTGTLVIGADDALKKLYAYNSGITKYDIYKTLESLALTSLTQPIEIHLHTGIPSYIGLAKNKDVDAYIYDMDTLEAWFGKFPTADYTNCKVYYVKDDGTSIKVTSVDDCKSKLNPNAPTLEQIIKQLQNKPIPNIPPIR